MSEESPKPISQPEGKKKGFRGPHPDVGKATRIKKGEVRNPEGKNGQDYITRALKEVFGDVDLTTRTIRGILRGKSAIAKVMLLEKAADRLEGADYNYSEVLKSSESFWKVAAGVGFRF